MNYFCQNKKIYSLYIFISVCPRAGPSLQTQAPRLQFCPKTDLPLQTQEPRCDSFPLLSAPHSLFSIWTNLRRSEKIPGAPTRRRGVWIWLTGPSGLHRNSAQGLNICSIRVFDQIRDPEIPIALPQYVYIYIYIYNHSRIYNYRSNIFWNFCRPLYRCSYIG